MCCGTISIQIVSLGVHGEVTLAFRLRAERAEEILGQNRLKVLKGDLRRPKLKIAKSAAASRPPRPKTAYGVARSACG